MLTWVKQYGQLWREGYDIATYDSSNPNASRWNSVLTNYGYNNPIGRYSGPGNWNDPDFLIAGDSGLSTDESKSQVALWAMMAAPMIMSSDVGQALGRVHRRTRQLGRDRGGPGFLGQTGHGGRAERHHRRAVPPAGERRPRGRDPQPQQLLGHHQHHRSRRRLHRVELHVLGQGPVGRHDQHVDRHDQRDHSGARHRDLPGHARPPAAAPPNRPARSPAPAASASTTRAAAPSDGNPIVLWPCTGNANQRWQQPGDGTVRTLGKCLDTNGGSGTKAELATCTGATDQQWTYQLNGNLINKQSGLCLDVTGGGSADGTALEAWSCGDNQLNQIWSLPA